ncbi:MAG TPA: extracellular solute-binding protein [Actinomycetota bacterium]
MQFRVLGPLEALDGGRALDLGGPKQRILLAHLLLRANRTVAVERLIEAVWGDDPPATARNTLQTHVKNLRKALDAGRIEHRPSGYLLRAEPEEVDLLTFEARLDEARGLAPHDLAGASETLRRALDLWRGPALDGLGETAPLAGEAARLEELRLAATEDRIEADLALGRHRELVPELETLVARHPFRERLWGQLMVALYRSGRQGDALAAFVRARDLLAEELGIDPSPELRRLQQQVLRQDVALEPGGEPLRGYRLLEAIGEGSFGVVHRAFQPEVGREVAVKVVRRELANHPDFIRRFDVEAQLVARLEHPHIVPLYDYWREPDAAYLVMRYLRGGSLRDQLGNGPLELERAARVAEQVALALSSAHRQDVVHRDVKPENVLFDQDGNAYLTDFGIAKDLVASAEASGIDPSMGWYVSPEEARGEPVSALVDVYGLGLVLHESLAGRHPFTGSSPAELLERQAREPLPPLRSVRPELPEALDEVLARSTAKDPGERYPDVLAFAEAFRAAATSTRTLAPVVERRNPYKGLRPFDEADAGDFFGREAACRDLLARLGEEGDGSRFVAVVGPSGSGKSSLVRAGVVPALRRGALLGSDRWFVAAFVPGEHPFQELDAALERIAVDAGSDRVERMQAEAGGLLHVAEEILPGGEGELLLVIDQFEEVFTLVRDEERRARFLGAIVAAATDPRSRVRIVATLRADFYDRPLLYRSFGELLGARTYVLTPLSPAELERAVAGPAEVVGIAVEPSLVGEIVAEVADRPAALPLLQYVLTEAFEGRSDSTLTLEAYRELGGVSGALARRAEELFLGLGHAQREAARQLFLRLVGPTDGGSDDTRRRVARSELVSVEGDGAAVESVIDTFGARRLLSFDRDPETRGPTVEVAHEALLREWARLRGWIESAREDLRVHARLSAAAAEWLDAGRSPDYLLAGGRLDQAEERTTVSSIRLTEREREYLEASVARRDAERAVEHERQAREARLERRAFVRMRALVAVLAVASLVAATLTIVAVQGERDFQRERDLARVSSLSRASVSNLRTDPELAVVLALHAVNLAAALERPVPAEAVEALHWAMQSARIEYPEPDGPTAVLVGPLGEQGILDLPLSQLFEQGRSQVTRELRPFECERFLGTPECPMLPARAAHGLRAEPLPTLHRTPAQPLEGTEVTMLWQNVHQDPRLLEPLLLELRRFEARTGIEVTLVDLPEIQTWISRRDVGGDPPDIAFAIPSVVADLAGGDHLVDLGVFVDLEQLRADQSPYLVSLGTVDPDGSWPAEDGGLFGAFVQLNVKSLIWYPAPELQAAGYDIPRTLDELAELGRRLMRDGRTPWCLGLESGPDASGWQGTDWIENLVLAEAGGEAYDAWSFHRLPFDSVPVRRAFERFADIAFTEGSVNGGPDGALRASIWDAQLPMIDDPPGCWLYLQASFAEQFLPPGSSGSVTDVFPFPSASGRFPGLIGGGEMVAAFSDRPEVREVVRLLLGPDFGTEMTREGNGFLIANRRFELANYSPFQRRQAEYLHEALAADAFRFDASDLMPPSIGAGDFLDAMMTYLEHGPESLDRILARLDAAWPDEPVGDGPTDA